ncbi:MAG: hypothetical protein ACPGO5_00115 [Patescibacteria group bacterium]
MELLLPFGLAAALGYGCHLLLKNEVIELKAPFNSHPGYLLMVTLSAVLGLGIGSLIITF